MNRIGSQLCFCSPTNILRNSFIERDEQNIITLIDSLENSSVESSGTFFFDGILSGEIISVSQLLTKNEISNLKSAYNYFNLSEVNNPEIERTNSALVLDFGENSTTEIESKIRILCSTNPEIDALEMIAACVYFPALLLNQQAELGKNKQTKLILWENLNLQELKLTNNLNLRKF